MRSWKRFAVLAAMMAGQTSAFGAATLTSIGALTPAPDGGVVNSKIHAISPDGTWAVGSSNGQNLAGTITISQAIIWSAGSGLVQVPNPNDQANHAHGVVVNASGDIIVAGFDYDSVALAYRMASYSAPTFSLTSGSWIVHVQHNAAVGEYNAERVETLLDSSTVTNIAGRRGNGNRGIASQVESGGLSYTDYPTTGNVPAGTLVVCNTVSSVTRNASSNTPVTAGYDNGYDTVNNRRRAIFMITTSTTQTVIPGGSAYQSEALGMSPQTTTTAGSGMIVGYDQDTTASHLPHAFLWNVGDLAMTALPELAGDNQSAAIDVRLISGNRIIGGYSSDGTTEKAVLWDSTGTWDNTGLPKSLLSLLTTAGTDVSAWSSLSRITTMSDDGKTLAGWGVSAADGKTRGFVAKLLPVVPRHPIAWRSMRSHSGLGSLPIALNATATGNSSAGAGGPSVETRGTTSTGGAGITTIRVDFDATATAPDATKITVTGYTTTYPGGTATLGSPTGYAVTTATMFDADTMEITFSPALPDQSCFVISLGLNTIAETVDQSVDHDVTVRGLNADANLSATISNGDVLLTKSRFVNGTVVDAGANVGNVIYDYNLSGTITNADVLYCKAQFTAQSYTRSALCP